MKQVNKELVKQLIAGCKGGYKWDRSSYEYAINMMNIHFVCSAYKLPELKEKFYSLIETKFDRIAGFTTFRDNDCYLVSVDYSNLPQNETFVITKEYLSPNSEFTSATPEQLVLIKKDGFTVHFLMYSDDDELYYGGYLKTDLEGCNEAFNPLDDYGAPNAGCTDIRYRENDGKYHSL